MTSSTYEATGVGGGPVNTGCAAGTALDGAQRRAVEWPRGDGNLLVVGGPGTGKSLVAVEAAVLRAREIAGRGQAEREDGGVLLLSPQRRRADALATSLAARLQGTGAHVEVRTPSGAAFEIVRRAALAHGRAAPALLSGAEVDAQLAGLLAGHAEGAGRAPGWESTRVPEAALALPAFRDELRDLLTRAAEAGLSPDALAELGRKVGRPEWASAAEVMLEHENVLALRDEQGARRWHYDHARVMVEAAHQLDTWQQNFGERGPHYSAVVVDDYQDATPALTALLRQFAADGAQLILTADPDVAVQQFRGGDAHLPGEATYPRDGAHPTGLGAQLLRLPNSYRGGQALLSGLDALRRHLPTTLTGSSHRRVDLAAETGGGTVVRGAVVLPAKPERRTGAHGIHLAVAESANAEGALIARRLREEHLLGGVPLESMAVLARSSGQVTRLRAALRAADVPTDTEVPVQALREEPAVRPLLDALHVAQALAEHRAVDVERVQALLQSPIGALSAVQVRILLRALRVLDEDDNPDDVLLRALLALEELLGEQVAAIRALDLAARQQKAGRDSQTAGAQKPGTQGGDASAGVQAAGTQTAGVQALGGVSVRGQGVLVSAVRGLLRVSGAVLAARDALTRTGASVSSVLWAAWNQTGLAGLWQGIALGGGLGAERAHADLDAVMALFAAAERHDERNAGQGIAGFLIDLEDQDVPQDTIAARGRRSGAVTVQTAASAAGRAWEFVVVAGVQADAWPDMRIRDTLLGAADLVDVLRGGGPRSAREKRAEVLADELRLFVAALSRASRLAMVTAYADADEVPSMFVEALAGETPLDALRVEAPEPLTLRGLVGELRHAAEVGVSVEADGVAARRAHPGGGGPNEATRGDGARAGVPRGDALLGDARQAARLLAALAEQGVAGADPQRWYGVAEVSTTQPLVAPGERVRVSPSAVAGAKQCALNWLLTRHGGDRMGSDAATIGTLVHAIAQEHPTGDVETVLAAVREHLPSLGYDRETWAGRQKIQRIEAMVERLGKYLQKTAGELAPDAEDRILVEVPIPATKIGERAEISGRTDRLELLGGEGEHRRWRVVDFKTSASPMKTDEALKDPQLALYQVGVAGTRDEDGTPLGCADGARLVYLGTGVKATERAQLPLGDAADPALPEGRFTRQDAEKLIDEAATIMGGAEFHPTAGEWCRHCPVKSVCPLGDEDR